MLAKTFAKTYPEIVVRELVVEHCKVLQEGRGLDVLLAEDVMHPCGQGHALEDLPVEHGLELVGMVVG